MSYLTKHARELAHIMQVHDKPVSAALLTDLADEIERLVSKCKELLRDARGNEFIGDGIGEAMTKSDPKAWFAFDGEHFEMLTSPEEAKKAAESALCDYKSEAGEGWSEDAYNVCWGRIMEAATVTVERPREPNDCVDADIDTIQEIELRGVHPLWLQCPCAESMQRWKD